MIIKNITVNGQNYYDIMSKSTVNIIAYSIGKR